MNKILLKITLVAIAVTILLLIMLIFTYDTVISSDTLPSLIAIVPDRASSEKEVIISGLSYRDGSEVIFYKGITEQIRTIALASPIVIIGSSPIRLTSSEFSFIVPILPPNTYSIRLSHPDLGISNSIPFSIIPLVSSISQNKGDHLTNFQITGSGFTYTGQKNIARLFPLPDIIRLETVQPRVIISFSLSLEPWFTYSYAPPLNDNGTFMNNPILISGSGVPLARGSAYLDINGNYMLDLWEPSHNIDVSTTGEFSTSLWVPADLLIRNTLFLVPSPVTPIGSYRLEIFTVIGDNIFESSYKNEMNRTLIITPHLNAVVPSTQYTGTNILIPGIFFHNDITKVRISFLQDGKKIAEIKPTSIELNGTVILAKTPELLPGEYSIKVSVEDFNVPGNYIESDNQVTIRIIQEEEKDR